jgi:predicted nucleic acid-binding protein
MYIDTSVAVKLYTHEADSDACEAVVDGADLVSSELLYCEFRSALFAKERLRMISAQARDRVWEAFEQSLAERVLQLIPLDGAVVREAADILGQVHPTVALRTLDALHLATYLSIEAGPLFTKDKRMRNAAGQLNLTLAD